MQNGPLCCVGVTGHDDFQWCDCFEDSSKEVADDQEGLIFVAFLLESVQDLNFRQDFLNGSETSETLLLAELYVAKLSLKCCTYLATFVSFWPPLVTFSKIVKAFVMKVVQVSVS